MLPRERIQAALDFKPVDKIPLQIFAAPGGLYEHGQKLVDLIKACGHDFGDFQDLVLPAPPGPEDFDPDGSYHAIKTDDWGTTWEYRIFGVWGHPVQWPLNDLAHLPAYTRPPAKERILKRRKRWRKYISKASICWKAAARSLKPCIRCGGSKRC